MTSSVVSIIIPLFNSENYIAETIHSCLNQSWENIEILVIDDGSTDNSAVIVNSITDDRIKYIFKENSGSANTRNIGLSMASGDYIQFLDADDLLSKDKIRNQLSLLSQHDGEYIASCKWGKFEFDQSEASFEVQKVMADYDPVDWLVDSWEGGGSMQTACWLTPKSIIERNEGWNELLVQNPNDDGEYFARIILSSEGIKFCSDAIVFYRDYMSSNRVSKYLTVNAVNSLFQNCILFEKSLLDKENTGRTRHAVMMNYSQFIYRFYPLYVELVDEAFRKLEALGYRNIPRIGGRNFNAISYFIGTKQTLRLRGFFRNKKC